MTPAQMKGRIGGLRLASTRDPREYTAAARHVFLTGDHANCSVCGCPPPIPEGLTDPERQRRLDARRNEHMARLAMRSVNARRRR